MPGSSIQTQKALQSILVKPAGPDCNLHCAYCFYLKKDSLFAGEPKHRMSDRVLEEMIKQAMDAAGPTVNFGWQGGEPTLMGRRFFEKAVEAQIRFGRPGQMVGNGLQTNGILIDKSFAQFLAEAKFLVGLSLDGPQHVHDRYRTFQGGKSSWQQVVRARDTLLDAGVEVNAVIVVNDYSVRFPKEIYEFHKKSGLTFMQFIPAVEPDPHDPTRAAAFSVSGEAFGRFLCELFDLWTADFRYGQPTTSIRWFDSVFYTYVGLQAPECTLLPECGNYVVVEYNGDVFSCDFFVEPEWKLGNVLQGNLYHMLNSPLQQRFGALKRQVPDECCSCEWVLHCFGGCPKDRKNDPADRGSNHFCTSYKTFFAHADARLRREAQRWLLSRGAAMPQPAQAGRFQASADDRIRPKDPCPCGSGKRFKNCCGRVRFSPTSGGRGF